MIKLTIATGKSRTDVKWKNQEITWDRLTERLKDTKRTPETVAEYKAMPKTQQGETKDVGGFVGGRLNGERRTAHNIDKRSLVVLDLDYATKDAIGDIDLLCDFAWAIYSTHTHTPEHPRYRLLVPTSREVAPDEYEPIARWLADMVGIEQCDASTYDPARLMYWPSTSKDGEYVYKDGGFGPLDVDMVLRSYPDWKNPIYWPTAEREARAEAKRMEKAEDPLLKQGTIGAFCRAYPISAVVVEFLPDIYERIDDGRYTYLPGSTAGGAKVYEDRWMYSHHGTDPTGGQLCNAFDLVRIHKYGVLDKDVPGDTPVMRLPSYDAMMEWAVDLPDVVSELAAEQRAEIKMDFCGVDWEAKLERNQNTGFPRATIDNIAIILLNSPDFKDQIGMNLLTFQITVKKLPWRDRAGDWSDLDDAALRHYFQKKFHITGKELIADGLSVVLMQREFHPVRDFLAGLPDWDGVNRVDSLLIDYFGADDNELVRAMTRKTLVAAVARVICPGVKFDQMLILQGAQGIGKSTLWKNLADPWFSDSIKTMEGKEAYEQLSGVWIGEMAELTATKKSEIEAQKAFLSSQVDHYRPAYGRRMVAYHRQCILVGTTNELEFLRDRTGNRRFWTVRLQGKGRLSVWNMSREVVEQIWAEAKFLYTKGEKLCLDRNQEALLAEKQEEFTEDNGLQGIIEQYLAKPVPARWLDMTIAEQHDFMRGFHDPAEELVQRTVVCAREVATLALDEPHPKSILIREIKDIIRRLKGWQTEERTNAGKAYGRQRCFIYDPMH